MKMSGVKLRICSQGSRYEKRNTEKEYCLGFLVQGSILQFSGLKPILSCLPLFEISTCTSVNNFRRITAVQTWHCYPSKLHKAREMPSYRHRSALTLLSHGTHPVLHKTFLFAAGDKEVAVWIINSMWDIRKCPGVSSALHTSVLWSRSGFWNLCGLFPVVEEAEDLPECLGVFSAKEVKSSSLVLELIILIVQSSLGLNETWVFGSLLD